MILTGRDGRKRSVTTPREASGRAKDMLFGMTVEERALAAALESELGTNGMKLNDELEEHIYHTQPVSMAEFLENPYYLGESCSTLYPELRKDLIALFDRPYREVVLTGGIGVGKTFSLSIAICRIIYELSCMISPQKTFGLSSGTEMVIPLISKNLTLAREVMKSAVDDKIKESPYFMTKFTPDVKKEYTIFPHNIRLTIGSYGSDRILGSNVFTAGMDETNFPPRRKAQQIATGFGQKLKAAHFDIVEKMYRGLVRRIKSRFQKAGGGFPGMVILASSAATLESFTERKIRDSIEDPDVFVRDHTQWTAKPKENFCGEFFYILCSRSAMKSRILKDDEYDMVTDEFLDANEAFILDIPIEFKDDFESDMENSLRDIAGFATEAISQFMQRPKAIEECTDDREHPFSDEEWGAGTKASFDWDSLCVQFERNLPGGFKEPAFSPRRNPTAMRWCHMDTSVSGDSTGICVAHVERWVEVVRRDTDGNTQAEVAPYYVVDFMLRVNPPPAEQIYMPDLRTVLYQFMNHGYKFIGFSTDSYQYVEMHQQVKRRGVTPHLISMDTNTDPYDELKSALYEHRIEIYNYKPFIDELKHLEYDRVVGKVDHPLAGSKDVSDAVAGAIWGLKKSSTRMPLSGKTERSKMPEHEHAWVSRMIPAESVNQEVVETAKEGMSAETFMPILFGD